jgi:putative toxin-antitoxin system antitoxin component (TIGR02293 family)
MAVRIDWVGKSAPAEDTDVRVARLTALAIRVFGSQDKATRWLRRPRREFGGVSPLEMMETEAAARQVEMLLRQFDDESEP